LRVGRGDILRRGGYSFDRRFWLLIGAAAAGAAPRRMEAPAETLGASRRQHRHQLILLRAALLVFGLFAKDRLRLLARYFGAGWAVSAL